MWDSWNTDSRKLTRTTNMQRRQFDRGCHSSMSNIPSLSSFAPTSSEQFSSTMVHVFSLMRIFSAVLIKLEIPSSGGLILATKPILPEDIGELAQGDEAKTIFGTKNPSTKYFVRDSVSDIMRCIIGLVFWVLSGLPASLESSSWTCLKYKQLLWKAKHGLDR